MVERGADIQDTEPICKKPGFICSAAQMSTCSGLYFVSAKEMLSFSWLPWAFWMENEGELMVSCTLALGWEVQVRGHVPAENQALTSGIKG